MLKIAELLIYHNRKIDHNNHLGFSLNDPSLF